MNQRVAFLILYATHRVPARPAHGAHVSIAATEVQAPCVVTGHGTRPIDALRTDIQERTTVVAAEARQGQFQRGADRPGCVIATPAISFRIPLRFGWQAVSGRAGIVDPVYLLPQIVVARAAPVPRLVRYQDKTPVTRLVGTAQHNGRWRIAQIRLDGYPFYLLVFAISF
jgi:hypothetical protein